MIKLFLKGVFVLGISGLMTDLAAQNISRPSGELEKTTADDVRPLNERSSTFNEVWAYHIYLDNGSQLYLSYMLANFGSFMSPVSGARLSVINFNDNYYNVAREYPLSRLNYDQNSYKLRLHPDRDIWFEGKLPETHRIRFKTSKDGVDYDIDLKLSEIQSGFRWGDGIFKVDNETIRIQSHIPYAKVNGKVSIEGTSKQVSGTVYMDHTYQSNITPRVLASGYRFIKHQQDDNWAIGYYLIPEDKSETDRVVGYSLKRSDGEISLSKPDRLTLGQKIDFKNGKVPGHLKVTHNPKGSLKVSVSEGLERLSFLSELSGLRRSIARSYLRGEVIEYRGVGKLNDETPIFLNYFRVE